MIRALSGEALLFFLPFVAVRALPVTRRRKPAGLRALERRDALARHRRPRLRRSRAALLGTAVTARRGDGRVRAAAHGERTARPGPVPVTGSRADGAPARLLRRPALARLFGRARRRRRGDARRRRGGAQRAARPAASARSTSPPRRRRTSSRPAPGRPGIRAVPTGLDHGTVTVVVERHAVRGHDPARGRRDGRAARGRPVRPRFRAPTRGGATSPSTRSVPRRRRGCTTRSAAIADLARDACASSAMPATRIREDYLRILRFFRFHAEYGAGRLDPDGLEAAGPRARRARDAVAGADPGGAPQAPACAPRRRGRRGAVGRRILLARVTGGVGEIGRLARAAAREAGAAPDGVGRLAALAVATARTPRACTNACSNATEPVGRRGRPQQLWRVYWLKRRAARSTSTTEPVSSGMASTSV